MRQILAAVMGAMCGCVGVAFSAGLGVGVDVA